MIILHFIFNRSTNMNYFIYTSHHFTAPENMNSTAEVSGSNPVEALIFSGFFFPIPYIGKFTAMIILPFVIHTMGYLPFI